jgi:hypothetical protein
MRVFNEFISGGTQVFSPFLNWTFTGNGSTTTYQIPDATATLPSAYLVYIDGVVQAPTNYYIASGNPFTIVFSTAIPNGSQVVIVCMGSASTGEISSASVVATGSTTPRTLANRFSDVVNVLDFGADPTGVVDSTDKIQAALNSGATAVFIPAGEYICGTLVMPNIKNFVLYGVNEASRLIMKNSGKLITWAGNAGSIYYQQGTIRDIYIDGTNGTNHCIDTSGVGGIDLINIYIFNVPVNFDGIYVNGFGSERTHDINIRGHRSYSQEASFRGAGRAAISFGPLASDANVEEFLMNGNYNVNYCLNFEANATGIYINGGHPYNAKINVVRITDSQSLFFTGVGIDSSNDNSVEIFGGGHYHFENCFFQNIGSGKIGLNISGSAQFINVIGGRFQGVGATSAIIADNTTNGIRVNTVNVSGSGFSPAFLLSGTSSFIVGSQNLGLDGSDTLPFYSFNGDPDTGIWRPSADRMEFVSNGTRKLLITDDGRIVLGTNGSFQMANGIIITSGNGNPEGVVTAPRGSTFLRADGGAGTSFYIKESGTGNVGWTAK